MRTQSPKIFFLLTLIKKSDNQEFTHQEKIAQVRYGQRNLIPLVLNICYPPVLVFDELIKIKSCVSARKAVIEKL